MSNILYGKEKSQENIIEQTKNSNHNIYPILKPGYWVGLKTGAINSNLINTEARRKVVIGYGINTPDSFVYLTQKHLKSMDQKQITNEAFKNLENYQTEFRYSEMLQNKGLIASGNDFSSEKILSHSHMLKAHAMLGADDLLVSIARRSSMIIISRDTNEALLGVFLDMHSAIWSDDSSGNAPIANILFTVKEGHITGHIALDDITPNIKKDHCISPLYT